MECRRFPKQRGKLEEVQNNGVPGTLGDQVASRHSQAKQPHVRFRPTFSSSALQLDSPDNSSCCARRFLRPLLFLFLPARLPTQRESIGAARARPEGES